MDDAVSKLNEYMGRVGRTYNLVSVDQRALTALYDYSLPKAEVVPSLAELQVWLAAHLAPSEA